MRLIREWDCSKFDVFLHAIIFSLKHPLAFVMYDKIDTQIFIFKSTNRSVSLEMPFIVFVK